MTSTTRSVTSAKEAREFYETKEKAAKFYADNGVPQKMEEILNAMFYENPTDVYGHLATYFEGFAKVPLITKIKARAAIDSKTQPTIQTDVHCKVKNKDQLVSTSLSSSPAGLLSELAKQEDKDEEDKEREENVKAAVKFLNTDICNRLQGLDPTNQSETDSIVSKLISDLKQEEDAKIVREMAEKEKSEGEEEVEKKSGTGSAVSKQAPKSPKGKSKGGAPVVIVPDEPREKLLRGSMCVSAISQAVCSTGATVLNKELYEHVATLKYGKVPEKFSLPQPMVTMLQSGRASPGKSNCVKEFMIVPKPGVTIKECLPQIITIYNNIVKAIMGKNGMTSTARRGEKVVARNVTDLGALMYPLDRPEQGLDMIQEAITTAGLTPGEDFYLALNLAGHEIFDYDPSIAAKEKVSQSFPLAGQAAEKGKYEVIIGQQKVADDLVEYWCELLGRYPAIIAIIDPMRKAEARQWMSLCERITERCYVMGEQVFPRPGVFKDEEITDDFKASGIVFNMEQMNTISDILDCAKKIEENGGQVVMSTSIGETTDTFLTDMAIGINARFIKLGAPCRGERIGKLNRLLAVEEYLKEQGKLSQPTEFVFPHITPPAPPDIEDGEVEEEPKKETPKKK